MYDGIDVTAEVNELVHADVPFLIWLVLFAACERSFTVDQLWAAVELLVASGWVGELINLPSTRPEQTLFGNQVTLMARWGTHRDVPFVTHAYMRLSHIATQIILLRNSAYIVNGGVVWPDVEPTLTTLRAFGQLPATHLRTAELVAQPVFNFV